MSTPTDLLALARQCGGETANKSLYWGDNVVMDADDLAKFAAALQAAQPDREAIRQQVEAAIVAHSQGADLWMASHIAAKAVDAAIREKS